MLRPTLRKVDSMKRLLDWFDTLDRPQKAITFIILLPVWLIFPRMRQKVKDLFVSLWGSLSRWATDIWESIVEFAEAFWLSSTYKWHKYRGAPLPDLDLMTMVAGSDDVRWFIRSGKAAVRSARGILAKNGVRITREDHILDFGCGVGRVIRHWKKRRTANLYGSDYNPSLIDWADSHLKFAQFSTNELKSPLAFEDKKFNLAYAFSVFTHLTEEQQLFWIDELNRIMKLGGHLLVSVHGQDYYLPDILQKDRARFLRGELIVYGGDQAGTNICTVFHPKKYIYEKFARNFEIIDYISEGALGNPCQDLVLLRKTADSSHLDQADALNLGARHEAKV